MLNLINKVTYGATKCVKYKYLCLLHFFENNVPSYFVVVEQYRLPRKSPSAFRVLHLYLVYKLYGNYPIG